MKLSSLFNTVKRDLKDKRIQYGLAVVFALGIITTLGIQTNYLAALFGRSSQAAPGEAILFLLPSEQTVNSRNVMEIWITADSPIVFASGEVIFDTSLLQLTDEPTFVSDLSRIVKATSRNKGNTEGLISFALALDPTARENPPSGTFKIAELYFSPQANVSNTTTSITFNPNSQIVFSSTNPASVITQNAEIEINPQGNGPTTTTSRTPSPTRKPTVVTSGSPQPTSGGGGNQTTLIFTPTDDVRLEEEDPKENHEGETSLRLDNDPIEQFLIKFNVTGINNRRVTRAYMRLYVINDSDKGGNFRYIPNNNWSESSVTWENAPKSSGVAVSSLGKVQKNKWVEVEVGSVISKDGTYTFRADSTSKDGADYASTERSKTYVPQLVVIVE